MEDSERECLVRAMYFESHRSSDDGLLAVGTVVMNRVASPKFPDTICGVVGQKRQFAPGVLTRKMSEREMAKALAAADAIQNGERNSKVGSAMFFHQAGLRFSYNNMHYVTVAGGNAFYEKRSKRDTMMAAAPMSRPAAVTTTSASSTTAPRVIPASTPSVPLTIEDLIEPAGAYD